MKENELFLPRYSTCRVCRNNLNQVCIEVCVPEDRYTHFEPKSGLTLGDLPPFPRKEFQNGMPSKVRQAVVGLYMEKMVDKLQGRENERPDFYNSTGRRVPTDVQKQDISVGPKTRDTVYQDKPECENTGERSFKMD